MGTTKSLGDVSVSYLLHHIGAYSHSTADSDLTPAGVVQALHIKYEWEKERAFGIPLPDKIYTSPLTRALRTCDIAFDWLVKGEGRTPVLVVEVSSSIRGVTANPSRSKELSRGKRNVHLRQTTVADIYQNRIPEFSY